MAVEMQDITGADHVEILIRNDSKVLWINVNGVCALRVCQIKELDLIDKRTSASRPEPINLT